MGKLPKRVYPPLYVVEWIEALGAERAKVAKAGHCTQSYISNMGGGRRLNPSAYVMYYISEFLGVTVNDLYQPPPPESSIEAMRALSPRARATLMSRRKPN